MSSKFMAPDHTASKSEPGSVRGLRPKLSARSLQRLSVERPSSPTTQPLRSTWHMLPLSGHMCARERRPHHLERVQRSSEGARITEKEILFQIRTIYVYTSQDSEHRFKTGSQQTSRFAIATPPGAIP